MLLVLLAIHIFKWVINRSALSGLTLSVLALHLYHSSVRGRSYLRIYSLENNQLTGCGGRGRESIATHQFLIFDGCGSLAINEIKGWSPLSGRVYNTIISYSLYL